jgi:hypothetical protein
MADEDRDVATMEGSMQEEAVGQELTVANAAQDLEPVKKTRKIIRKKKRKPARVQVDPSEFKSEPPPQTGVIFK